VSAVTLGLGGRCGLLSVTASWAVLRALGVIVGLEQTKPDVSVSVWDRQALQLNADLALLLKSYTMLDPHRLIAARYFFCLVQVISFHLELLLKNDDEKLENISAGPPYNTRGGGGQGVPL
jgi:hypothetical protein